MLLSQSFFYTLSAGEINCGTEFSVAEGNAGAGVGSSL
jgi:hypothetical protein